MTGQWMAPATVELPCGCTIDVDHNRGERAVTCCDRTFVITAGAPVQYQITERVAVVEEVAL